MQSSRQPREKRQRRAAHLFACVAAASFLCVSSVAAQTPTITYTYDALGRVTSVAYPNGMIVTYTYDAAGNRLEVTRPPPNPSQSQARRWLLFNAVLRGN